MDPGETYQAYRITAHSDVRIHLPARSVPTDILSFADGTMIAGDAAYSDGARVPVPVWHAQPTWYFKENVRKPFKKATDIAVIDVPEHIERLLAYLARTLSYEWPVDYRERVLAWLRGLSATSDIELRPFRQQLPNRRTLTQDEHGKLIGLHLDNWDGLPLRARGGARNRICVNVSGSARYLLTVPHSVSRLVREGRISETDTHPDAAAEYFRRHPSTIVARLQIFPGQAYIAPTENLFHDGSSDGEAEPCVTVTAFGNFTRLIGAST